MGEKKIFFPLLRPALIVLSIVKGGGANGVQILRKVGSCQRFPAVIFGPHIRYILSKRHYRTIPRFMAPNCTGIIPQHRTQNRKKKSHTNQWENALGYCYFSKITLLNGDLALNTLLENNQDWTLVKVWETKKICSPVSGHYAGLRFP